MKAVDNKLGTVAGIDNDVFHGVRVILCYSGRIDYYYDLVLVLSMVKDLIRSENKIEILGYTNPILYLQSVSFYMLITGSSTSSWDCGVESILYHINIM